MTRQDFLDELKQALSGEVPVNVMMESYTYYANYIDEEIRSGKSEAQVLEELGKPMLIARSIIAAQTGERQVDYEYTEDGRTKTVRNSGNRQRDDRKNNSTGTNNSGNSNSGRASNGKSNGGSQTPNGRQFVFDFSGILARAALVLFLILLVIIFFFVIKIGFWVLVTFGIPILLILGIVYLIMYFSR